MQSFGPRIETRRYDIGSGSLRNSPQNLVRGVGSSTIGNFNEYEGAIDLQAWLISVTSITSYKATDRSSSEALTEGYDNDYFLEPYNSNPKVRIKLNEDTSKGFYSGQQTLAVVGEWGYQNDSTQITTLSAEITDADATSITVTSATDFSPAQTILIGSEQLYITAISSNTLTVERGVNGTTADVHANASGVSAYDYPEVVVQACLDLGKIIFRDRDMGASTTIGGGEPTLTRTDVDAQSVLMTLDDYKAATGFSEVYFSVSYTHLRAHET